MEPILILQTTYTAMSDMNVFLHALQLITSAYS